ncbi:RNA polymerase sigma factor [Mucisphaera calidilacus]|uniref:ECF RNA polymerase sigma factor SigW n=1 Tax=Mucisphaera calidilacus TaxID=2527982 RepID=A0A518C103_9BACT|nr:RNA polymerase sigma factor [Mucisphaera calidilacus]QDU72902.1 ECF RNA polymerase sigma factor SigW [Mucisphaera calidilacus]
MWEGDVLPEREEQSVFLEWLDSHSGSVLKVARAYTLTHEECQDLAQEILMQAWRSLPGFEGRARPSTWFYRVALQTAMNWKRNDQKRRRWQKPLLELEAVGPEGLNGEVRAEHRETVERLYAAIHRLPKADTALVLLYLEALSYREMAEVLGLSESHVGVKLNRAKKALRVLMEGDGDEA